mmetsp:Transcript_28602/g.77173  ORF Transcript_28602/g.77173 Transcript_28602/m.77173 type:complete len:200 (+) Transcript_28602:64-663(+)
MSVLDAAPPADWLCQNPVPYHPGLNWAIACILAMPHILYAIVWFKPEVWTSVFNDMSLETFALAGTLGKVIQFTALTLWFWTIRPGGLCFSLEGVELWRWLAFLVLVSFGQALNVGIYKAIGKTGVYYGFKLGRKVPWVTGFPFNVMSHPQYVGSTMTIWGAMLMVHAVMPAHLQATLLYLTAYWSCLYLFSGYIEHFY